MKNKTLKSLYEEIENILIEGNQRFDVKKGREDAERLHNDDEYAIHHIKSPDAAFKYGRGTGWGLGQDFNQARRRGEIYTLHHKPSGEKYAIQPKSNTFIDKQGNEISKEELLKRHPIVHHILGHEAMNRAINTPEPTIRKSASEHPNNSEFKGFFFNKEDLK